MYLDRGIFLWQSVLMRAIPIPIRKRIVELYDGGKSTREIAQFSGFCVAAVRRVSQRFASAARCNHGRICAGARRCSPKRGSNGYSISLSNPTPRRPSWARAWTAPSRLPRSISGCGGSVGSLKKIWPPPNKRAPASPHEGRTGKRTWPPSPRAVWCLWTKAEPTAR